jgi:hypothetical protein
VEHGSISDAEPSGGVGSIQNCAVLAAIQGSNHGTARALQWNRENPANLIEKGRHSVLDEPHKGLDGCEARVSSLAGITALFLEMVQELEDHEGVKALEFKVRWRPAELPASELEQQLKRIRVGCAGMWTRAPLDSEPCL